LKGRFQHTLETRFVSVTDFVETLSPSLNIGPSLINRANGPIVQLPNSGIIQGEISGLCTAQIAIPGGIGTTIWSRLKSLMYFSRRLMRILPVSSGADVLSENGIT